MSVLLRHTSDGITTVTLNRPEARNALSSELLRALVDALREADDDPDTSVVILTGTDPAFCAGLDLKELGSSGGNLRASGGGSSPFPDMSKPLIGAVNGVAVTGGLELALNCDFLIASDRARFGDTHARVGIMPGWGLTVLLPRRIGLARSVEMSLTGNFVGAEEALRLGLVNHVVPHEFLMPVTRRIASDIAGNDGAAVRNLLAGYRRVAGAEGMDAGLKAEAATAREWQERFDPEEVERRRAAIMERGRSQ